MNLAPLVLCLAFLGGQDPPPVADSPIEVICPDAVPANRRAVIRVETEGKSVLVKAFRAEPGLDRDVTAEALDARADANSYSFTHDPGTYRIVAYAIVGDTLVSDDAELQVGPGDFTQPLPATPDTDPNKKPQPPPSAFTDEIKIIGPAEPIKEPQQVTLKVFGLSDAELPQASIRVTPTLDYMPVKTWTGDTVIVAQITSTTKPGKYTFTVGLNEWRTQVDEGLAAAHAANVSQDLLDEYTALSKKFADKYPAKSATCAIEVAGILPPPPPPIDPNSKVTQATYVFEKDAKNTPRPVALALQRINASGSGVVASEFEEDTTDGNGEVPDQYKIALEAARKAGLPALVVQSGATVLRVIKDPTTEAAVMEALK